jgi:hypothetical protein
MKQLAVICACTIFMTATALGLPEIGRGSSTGERVSVRRLVDDPRTDVGRRIVVPAIACVDNPKGGFVCVATAAGQALRITATSLGPKTRIDIAERLIRGCKGTANLTRAECRVDAEFELTDTFRDVMDTPNGSMPIVVLYSPQIEMYAPRRHGRTAEAD